jgi:branched-chain amino acid transport system permease protein
MSGKVDGSSIRHAVSARLSSEWLPVLLFGALLLVPILAGFFGNERFAASLAARVMILAIGALSLDLILGLGAMVSLGHAAFLGLGGYSCAILMHHGIGEASIALPIALVVCGLFALATGALSLRTEGVNFIMITLAFGQMAYFTMVSLSQYGGDDGIQLGRRSTLFGLPLLENGRAFHLIVWLSLVATYLLVRRIAGSRFGRVLRAARENPVRVAALGFPVLRIRLTAYVIAGIICGFAGFLFANHNAFVSPALMSWQRSGELLVMVILGGLGSLHGAILGAAAYLLVEEWLSGLTEHWKMIFGPFLVLVVLAGRGGLADLLGGARRE